jgi:hypothetical protein
MKKEFQSYLLSIVLFLKKIHAFKVFFLNTKIIYNFHKILFHCKFPYFNAIHLLNKSFGCIIFIVFLKEQITIFQVVFAFW